ncbi:SET domain-containing protein [Skeletonema marinoi]|uniref:SET domain-containing protein n=1 Tax=Skeletonema marinoi TaxID=267567 RepID=A0AAD8YD41_9STRA|nr:SET domain-containing protein [Skeletonema marinoi]
MPTPTRAVATTKRSDYDDGSTAADSSMEINVHVDGTIIPITLTHEKCTSTSSGELCKDFVENSLTNVDPRLILQILTKISPAERLTHYVMRYGDGYSSIIRIIWSAKETIHLVPAYIDVNMTLKPRLGGVFENTTIPHLPLLPLGVQGTTISVDVDLCISLVSTEEISFPSNVARTSVVHLKEHKYFPGCVDSYSVEAVDGQNNILPIAHMLEAPSITAPIIMTDVSLVVAAAVGEKRNAASLTDVAATSEEGKSKKARSDGGEDNIATKPPVAKELEKSSSDESDSTSTSSSETSSSAEKKDEATPDDDEGKSVTKPSAAVDMRISEHDGEDSFVGFGNAGMGESQSDESDSTSSSSVISSSAGKKDGATSDDDEGKSATKSSTAVATEKKAEDNLQSLVDFGNVDICNDSTAHAAPTFIELTAKSREIQKGLHSAYHPITKLQVRHCICANSECRKIVWQYAAMGNEKMTKYIVVPSHPPQANNKRRKYNIKFLECVARYFPQWKDKPKSEKTVYYLSITHFPPAHRDVVWNPPKSWTQRWRIPLSVGRMSGLKEQHKCKFGGDTFHFATPMLHRNAIAMELGEAIRAVLLEKRGTVLNENQSQLLEKFQESNGYIPITENDCGIYRQVLTANEELKTKSSPRLKGKQITCQCKQNHPNCVHSECANNNEFSRECDQNNCSFGETDCGNRFTTPMQVRAQSRARFVVLEFRSDKYSDPRVGSGAKAVVPFSENEIIGEYIGEVKKREENMSNYCVDIGEGYVIDAEKKGNAMRFIQHSCDPNCELIVRVHQDMRKRAWIRASKPIAVGEWITYKYHSNPAVLQQFFFNNQGCVCGSKRCLKPREIAIQNATADIDDEKIG